MAADHFCLAARAVDVYKRQIAERLAKKGETVINKNKEIFKEGYDTAVAAMQLSLIHI